MFLLQTILNLFNSNIGYSQIIKLINYYLKTYMV